LLSHVSYSAKITGNIMSHQFCSIQLGDQQRHSCKSLILQTTQRHNTIRATSFELRTSSNQVCMFTTQYALLDLYSNAAVSESVSRVHDKLRGISLEQIDASICTTRTKKIISQRSAWSTILSTSMHLDYVPQPTRHRSGRQNIRRGDALELTMCSLIIWGRPP
jgi:hypothetical protein